MAELYGKNRRGNDVIIEISEGDEHGYEWSPRYGV